MPLLFDLIRKKEQNLRFSGTPASDNRHNTLWTCSTSSDADYEKAIMSPRWKRLNLFHYHGYEVHNALEHHKYILKAKLHTYETVESVVRVER